jgi:tetratricopeptide (TPR) repeat protein
LAIFDVFEGNYEKALNCLLFLSQGEWGPFLPKILRIALIYEYMDKKELAKKYYEEALRNYDSKTQEGLADFFRHGFLGIAYAGLGRKEEAIREAKILEKSMSVILDAFYNPQVKILVYIYLLLGDHEKAIDQIEYLLTEGDQWSVPFVRNDPTWEPLHDHPRFQKLIKSAN